LRRDIFRVHTARHAFLVFAAVSLTCLSGACSGARTTDGSALPGSTQAVSARAASRPVLPGAYLGAMAGAWSGPEIRPSAFDLGADWSITRLTWTHWTSVSASGRGYYIASAGAACPCTRYWAAVTLTEVRDHAGHRYFARMKVTDDHRTPRLLVMNTRLGYWRPT